MISATVFETKTQLSSLLRKVKQGETVVTTEGRNRVPVAEVKAIQPKKPKRLGAREIPGFVLPESFWDPLPPEWTGELD